MAVSYGIIKNVLDYDIKHVCCTEKGSSGSPILSILSQKVIGIHKEGKSHFNINKGSFLKNPINEFINIIDNNTNFLIKYNKNMLNDYKNNFNNEVKIHNIKSQFSSFPCIGLTNIGDNCFLMLLYNAFVILGHLLFFLNIMNKLLI